MAEENISNEKIRVIVDAMGGDNAPQCTVEGAVDAVREKTGFDVILVGMEDKIKSLLSGKDYPEERISVVNCTEMIEMAESPVEAVRTKKDSSIAVGLRMLRQKEGEAFVSCGNTGAVIAGAQFIVGRIKGIRRSPLATLIPTKKGVSLLIDCGANVDARPEQLVQFAKMGSVYMENVVHVKDPKVGLVNIGAEDEKGNAQVKETMPLLRECDDINFVGSAEARDIPAGDFDVIVCDAFIGNVILKLYEGTGKALVDIIKAGIMTSLRSKIGGLLVKPALKETLKVFDASEYGGAPLLGLKALVVKGHGNSNAKEVKNAILQCMTFYKEDVNSKIKEAVVRSGE